MISSAAAGQAEIVARRQLTQLARHWRQARGGVQPNLEEVAHGHQHPGEREQAPARPSRGLLLPEDRVRATARGRGRGRVRTSTRILWGSVVRVGVAT